MEISHSKLEFIKTYYQLDGQRVFVEGLIRGLNHPHLQDETINISDLVEGLQDSLSEINDTLKVSGALL